MDARGNVASRHTRVFTAKIDAWLLILIACSTAVCLYAAWLALSEAGQGRWAMALVLLLSAAIPVWIVLSTSYTLSGTQLRVRCGPFRWTIPLAEIRDVRPTRNPLSSPAPSLDRLRIDYGERRSVMISPRAANRMGVPATMALTIDRTRTVSFMATRPSCGRRRCRS